MTVSLPEDIQKELQQRIFDTIPEPIIFADSTRKVVLANEAAAFLLEYPMAEIIGTKVAAFVPPELMTEQEHDHYFDSFLNGTRTRTLGTEAPLFCLTKYQNKIPVGLRLFVVEVQGQRFVGEIIRDRSQEVRQQSQIREQKNEIEVSARKLKNALEKENEANVKLEIALRKKQFQRDLIFGVIFLSAGLYAAPFLLLIAGVRVPDGIMSLSRDATILVLGTLGGAIAGITGYNQKEKEVERKDAIEASKTTVGQIPKLYDGAGNKQTESAE